MEHATSRPYLAAIDLDGTLLGDHAAISAENRAALDALVDRGFEVVLASGRHAANMADIARQLPMVEWMVSCQGCEVTDVSRQRVLEHWVLPDGVARRVARAGRERGFGIVGFTADGEVAPWGSGGVTGYEAVSKTRVAILGEEAFAVAPLNKVVWVGTTAEIDALIASGEAEQFAAGIATVRSHDRIFEFMPPGVTKATGVARLTAELGIAQAAVVSFGDADNDMPLFAWAGHSVAMPHARAHVRAAAKATAPAGDAGTAFARGVAEVLASGRFPRA